MKKNPDNRADNVKNIQRNIHHTIANIEAAEELINCCSDSSTKESLIEKNYRRKKALNRMRSEIRDEALYQEQVRSGDE